MKKKDEWDIEDLPLVIKGDKKHISIQRIWPNGQRTIVVRLSADRAIIMAQEIIKRTSK